MEGVTKSERGICVLLSLQGSVRKSQMEAEPVFYHKMKANSWSLESFRQPLLGVCRLYGWAVDKKEWLHLIIVGPWDSSSTLRPLLKNWPGSKDLFINLYVFFSTQKIFPMNLMLQMVVRSLASLKISMSVCSFSLVLFLITRFFPEITALLFPACHSHGLQCGHASWGRVPCPCLPRWMVCPILPSLFRPALL